MDTVKKLLLAIVLVALGTWCLTVGFTYLEQYGIYTKGTILQHYRDRNMP